MFVGWLVVLLAFDLPCTAKLVRRHGGGSLRPRFAPATLRRLILLALPMGVVFLAIQLRMTIPRTMLERSAWRRRSGHLLGAVLPGHRRQHGDPGAGPVDPGADWGATSRRADVARLRRRVGQLVLLGLAAGAAGVLVALVAGGPLLSLIYTADYARHAPLLVLIMAGGGILYVGGLLGAPATAMRAFRPQLWVHATQVVVMLGSGAVLIPRLGMTGAAWTMLIGSLWVAVWPFATSQTLGALANVLREGAAAPVTVRDYMDAFLAYTHCQRFEGKPYIGEYLDEVTGQWLKGRQERSRYYNHSTFADLVITGLVGLRPRADETVEVHPLLPDGLWDWFCLDGANYHGRALTVVWDKDGKRYGRGQGLSVLADGQLIAHSEKLGKLTGHLRSK